MRSQAMYHHRLLPCLFKILIFAHRFLPFTLSQAILPAISSEAIRDDALQIDLQDDETACEKAVSVSLHHSGVLPVSCAFLV